MRRKALVRQGFPIGKKQHVLLRRKKLPRRLHAQSLLGIGGENDFRLLERQVFGQQQGQAAGRQIRPNGFLGGRRDGEIHVFWQWGAEKKRGQ